MLLALMLVLALQQHSEPEIESSVAIDSREGDLAGIRKLVGRLLTWMRGEFMPPPPIGISDDDILLFPPFFFPDGNEVV